MKRFILAVSFISGFSALVNEVIWTKLLSLTLGNSTYALSIVLFSFLIGLAIGSYIIGKYLDNIGQYLSLFAFIELGIGFSGLLILLFFDKLDIPFLTLHSYFPESFYLFMGSLILLVFLLLLIPTMFMGATIPVMGKILTKDVSKIGTSIGDIFSINTLGGVFGAFTAGFILVSYLGLIKTGVFASALNLVLAGIIFYHSKRKWNLQFLTLMFSSFVVLLYVSSSVFNPVFAGAYYSGIRMNNLESWEQLKTSNTLLFHGSNEYGVVGVWRSPGHDYLTINGKVDAGTSYADSVTQLSLGYLPMFAKPDAKKVLGIGLGIGGSLSAIENFDVEVIDWVEINPLIVKVNREYFSEYNDNALDDERLNLIMGDGRNYLEYSNKKYDVITSEPSNIWVSGSGSLFTREFFESVSGRLNEGGIYTCWIPGYEFGEQDINLLLNTIHQVFPYVSVWVYGGDKIILASDKEISIDYYYMADNIYHNSGIYYDFINLDKKSTGLNKPHLNLENQILKGYLGEYDDLNIQETGQVNSDDLPVLEFSTLRNSFLKSGGYEFNFNTSILPVYNQTIRNNELDLLPLRIKVTANDELAGTIGYNYNFKDGIYEANFEFNESLIKIKAFEVSDIQIKPDDSEEVKFTKNLLAESRVNIYLDGSVYGKFIQNNYTYLLSDNGNSKMAGWYCPENSRIYTIETNDLDNFEYIVKRISCYTIESNTNTV
jgi:spermidine synthase